jgi:hypothetical protein
MATPESSFKDVFKREVEALGFKTWKVVAVGQDGFPDQFWAGFGFYGLVELKAPGGNLSPLQELTIRDLLRAGVDVRVMEPEDLVPFLLYLAARRPLRLLVKPTRLNKKLGLS